ncbi:hypothetical protein PoB_006710300 [Plakobranchus ocellatus]|uniref:Uncharacterized protein n=1 Tax=Plakobranchus ocellatus TaxID=259542 RepID=A0AAV4D972_9GAST|nr:hypothetical protein PoB_006710300 [Plakobranchus ocellatus]
MYSKPALISAGIIMSWVRDPPPAPWPNNGFESVRSPCGLVARQVSAETVKTRRRGRGGLAGRGKLGRQVWREIMGRSVCYPGEVNSKAAGRNALR